MLNSGRKTHSEKISTDEHQITSDKTIWTIRISYAENCQQKKLSLGAHLLVFLCNAMNLLKTPHIFVKREQFIKLITSSGTMKEKDHSKTSSPKRTTNATDNRDTRASIIDNLDQEMPPDRNSFR